MNVHVSLHPAVLPTVESAKVAEPSSRGASFSDALNAAAESAQPKTMQGSGGRDGEKKQQKKSDDAKDASETTAATQPVNNAQTALPAGVPTLPTTQEAIQTGVQSAAGDASEGVSGIEAIAAKPMASDTGADGVTNSFGLRPVRVAGPILSTVQGGTDVSMPVSDGDDTSVTAVEDGTVAVSGANVAASDELAALLPGIDPALPGVDHVATGAPVKGSPVGKDVPVSKGQPILGQGDSTHGVAPVSVAGVIVPPVSATPSQPSAASISAMQNSNAMTAATKDGIRVEDAKESGAEPASAPSVVAAPQQPAPVIIPMMPDANAMTIPSQTVVAGVEAKDGDPKSARVAPVAAAAAMPVPATFPTTPDGNAMTASAMVSAPGVAAKDGISKPVSMESKDRISSDVRGRHKTDDADDDSQSDGSSVTTPTKSSVAIDAQSDQGVSGQGAGKEAQAGQALQMTLTPAPTDAKTAPQVAGADVPAAPVPVATQTVADAASLPGVSGARLIQSIHQSEMKLGMNSAEFGNISITTSVTHQALSAQISLDHSELGRALAVHLPAMEEKLSNAYGLQARVQVNGGTTESYAGSSQQSGQGRQERQSGSAKTVGYASGLTPLVGRSMITPVDDGVRLDIRI